MQDETSGDYYYYNDHDDHYYYRTAPTVQYTVYKLSIAIASEAYKYHQFVVQYTTGGKLTGLHTVPPGKL